MASDRELVGAWRDGDDVAGRALFERYFSPLRRFFHGKVDGPIEDLIQLTLTACLEGAQKLRDDAAFRPYLFAIARHQLFAHYRRTHRDWARMQTQDTSVGGGAR
ncbi:MAG: sigma factor [Myxococcota bacterium]